MAIFWSLLYALPMIALGAASAFASGKTRSAFASFIVSKPAAVALTIIAWAGAAYEVAIFDVNIVHDLLGGLAHGPLGFIVTILGLGFEYFWALTPILAYLTIIWMGKNLPVRALSGVLMLLPTELFKTTRHLLPAGGGFAAVHLVIVAAYAGAILGMYGMFYPWRVEKAVDFLLGRPIAARVFGASLLAFGLAIAVCAFTI